MKNILCTLLLIIGFNSAITAQNEQAVIKGFAFEKESEAPISYATVLLKQNDKPLKSVVTNDRGYFVIDKVNPGTYELEITFLGFEPFRQKVTLESGDNRTIQAYMPKKTEMLKSVNVNAERQERNTKVLTGVVKLSPKNIEQFSVGGDADIVKAIQVLPGVVTTGDQGGQLYIRGGSPIQNLILMDGMVIYNPFHSIGFFSVFDSEIIESADVYSGGFKADYGSRTSAVVDIKTRDGNRERFAGKVSASTYTAKALLETPISKKDENGKAPVSLLVSAKTSYLDQTSSVFYDYIETEFDDGLPFSFTDIYGKVSAQSDNGSEFNAFGFSFQDEVQFAGSNDISWDATGLGANFLAVPGNSSVLINPRFNFSSYDISALQGGDLSTSSIQGINAGLDFSYFLSDNDQLKYGMEIITYETETQIALNSGIINAAAENTTELGGFARYRYSSERLVLEPSVRVHFYSSQSEVRFEPRIGVKYNINEWWRVKLSGGFYSQNLLASFSDQNVINLFYGFLSGLSPGELPSTFRGDEVSSTLQLARHGIAGFEFEVTENITLNVEGYVKDFTQITNVNRNKLFEDNVQNADEPDILKSDFILERGLARGLDILAKYKSPRWYLWLGYSWGKNTREDGIRTYNPVFDRRHNLNFIGTYMFGSQGDWEASVRYNFGSGFPFTPTQAFFSKQPFLAANGEPAASFDVNTNNGEPDVLFGELNSQRLPNYHRVDASVKRTVELKKNSKLILTAGATNILSRDNIFFFDREEVKRVDQLPIMPTISVAYSF